MNDTLTVAGVKLSREAVRNLEAVGSPDPETIVKYDLEQLRTGGWTRDSLLAYCLDGAEAEHVEGWNDYVSAMCIAARVA